MAAKKVSIGKKPGTQELPTSVDEWVASQESLVPVEQPVAQLPEADQPVKLKRLTLDIPVELHRAIKRKATDEGVTMADLLRALLEQHFGSSS